MLQSFPVFALICTLFIIPTTSAATTWDIYPNGSGDAPTIQAGIDSAAEGDTVLLHDGTYTGAGNKNLDPGGKVLTIRSENGAETTIINCENSGRGFYLHSGEQETTVLQGLTIRDGNADHGGGILVVGSSPLVKECFILDCVAVEGGGIFMNPPYVGERPTLQDCIVSGNQAITGGGIMVVGQGGYTRVESTVICGNVATGGSSDGGGICIGPSGASVSVEFCTISGNHAAGSGGGVYIPDSPDGFSTIGGTILWGNCASSGDELHWHGASMVVHCCIDATGIVGFFTMDQWVTSDPLFCDPGDCLDAPSTAGDYTLDAASPCLPENDPWNGTIGALGQGCDVVTHIAESGSFDAVFGLDLSPSPFSDRLSIRYTQKFPRAAVVEIFDIRGRCVKSLAVGSRSGGVLLWDGTGASGLRVAPGVYFVRLGGNPSCSARKVVYTR